VKREKEGGMENESKVKPPETQEEMIEMLTRALPFLRAELGISQQQLGEKLGFSRQTISCIERGEYTMGWSQFLSIIYFLKVNQGGIPEDKMTVVDKFLLVR